MAKPQNPSGDERSDIEFLYFKGKVRSVDIQQLVAGFTSTRSNALPARPQTKQLPPAGGNGTVKTEQQTEIEFAEELEQVEEPNGASASAAPKPSRGRRKYPTPDPVALDLESGDMPFLTFAAEVTPESHLDKYLVAAEWLRAYRNVTEITAGHVRTCYIEADWDFDPQDPNQPFRTLKKDGLGSIADGKFTVGHLGTSAVKKMMKPKTEPNA
jgi:hypothetical protein